MKSRAARSRRALAGTLGSLALLAGCNLVLGIEESPTRPIPEDAAVADVTDAADAATRPPFERCTRDTDCVAPNACYTPHCDTVLGACTYALCEAKGRTCAAGVCNTATFACSDAQPYSFVSTRYDVSGVTSGCGADPAACVAAAFPYVFLGTRDDVVALRVDDLVAKEPDKVAIAGLTVRPVRLLVSGRRLWVLGAVQGQAPPYQLPVAYLDVPSDPTVRSLRATSVVVGYPFPTATAFAAPNGGLYVLHDDAAQGLPTALVDASLAPGASFVAPVASAGDAGAPDASVPANGIRMYRAASAPAGASVVASSGPRLVAYRYPSTFNLVTAPGTANATAQPDLPVGVPVVPLNRATFAQGPDGTLMMTAPIAADPMLDCNCTSVTRLAWVFPNAVATATDVNQVVDYEGFVNGQISGGTCHQCTGDYFRPQVLATWLDRRTALTAAPQAGQGAPRTITDLRVLTRDPLGGDGKRRAQTKATDTPKGDFGADRIALTSASGFGYLVLADSQGNDVSLSIVDPRCDAR